MFDTEKLILLAIPNIANDANVDISCTHNMPLILIMPMISNAYMPLMQVESSLAMLKQSTHSIIPYIIP